MYLRTSHMSAATPRPTVTETRTERLKKILLLAAVRACVHAVLRASACRCIVATYGIRLQDDTYNASRIQYLVHTRYVGVGVITVAVIACALLSTAVTRLLLIL